MSLPKGENNGKIINLNFNVIKRWFVNKFILGFVVNKWYQQILIEGYQVYGDRKRQK